MGIRKDVKRTAKKVKSIKKDAKNLVTFIKKNGKKFTKPFKSKKTAEKSVKAWKNKGGKAYLPKRINKR